MTAVYFLSVWCPECGAHPVPRYGQRGKVRYHRCLECGVKFKSFELTPEEVRRRLSQSGTHPVDEVHARV